MFNKFTNKKLAVTFLFLLLLVAVVIILDNTGKESTFDQQIVSIDSTRVSKIILYPKSNNHKEVKLVKQHDKWQIQTASNKFKNVPPEKVNELIKAALKIQPLRLAAKNEKKWKEYQVDTSGTRVEMYEDDDKTLDIVIGKFMFQEPQSMTTFVRLTNENNVYAVDGFLEFIFNKTAESFRNEILVNLVNDEINKVSLNYTTDSSFVLEKVNGKWFINGESADSAKTADYTRTLSNLRSPEFADVQIKGQKSGSIKIESAGNKSVELNIYPDGVIASSANKDEVFYAGKLLSQIIKSPSDLNR